jgi:hypothetical protein
VSDTFPSRPGQVNGSGDAEALFRKQFAGEVLTAFKNTTVMMDKHTVRTIESGKGADFPVTGTAVAKYHTPGKRISDAANGYLNQILHGQRTINIDDLLISPVFIANLDEAMNHYDVRSIYSTECGTALALQMDRNILHKVLLAARDTTVAFTGAKTGSVINAGATVATTASVLAQKIFESAKIMDEKNIPSADRYAIVRPEQYYLLAQETDLINKDWGGAGVYADGSILKVAGVSIVKSNQLPNANIAAVDGEKNVYSGDFTKTVAAVFHKSAVGTVKLLDLAVEGKYELDLQGYIYVAKYACGHGVIRPEASIEISSAT